MFNNIHHLIIGYHKSAIQYRINIEILRENFSFGKNLWITTLFEGDDSKFLTGIGENCYINTKVSGYAYGALEQINKGLEQALLLNRDIVILHNFDVLFFNEEKYINFINEFIASDKDFGAAVDVNGLPATDCMIFKKEFIEKLNLPIKDIHAPYREQLEIAERYKQTELGFKNVEEWLWNHLIINFDKKFVYEGEFNAEVYDNIVKGYLFGNFIYKLKRTDLPRLRWSEEMGVGHLHEYKEIKEALIANNIKNGNVIKQLTDSNI